MYVGICQIEQVLSHKFGEWNWRDVGHGHYCIYSTGRVYSHNDPKVNDQITPFSFYVGDVLKFEYDWKAGKLTINNGEYMQYSMNVEKGTTKKYAVCAYLMDIGDEIELIDSLSYRLQ